MLSARRVVIRVPAVSSGESQEFFADVDLGCGVWLPGKSVKLGPSVSGLNGPGDWCCQVDDFGRSDVVTVREAVPIAKASNLGRDARRVWVYPAAVAVGSVYDGDTFSFRLSLAADVVLDLVRVRLHGVQAPELRGSARAAGLAVRDFVRAWFAVHGASCSVHSVDRDKFGRLVAHVFSASGVSLGDVLRRARLVRAFPS